MKNIRIWLVSSLILAATSAQALNAENIYKKVNKSVYTIYTVNFYDKSPESLGSAIAVTDHILATNCHVALTGNYLGIVVQNEFKLGTIFFRDVNRDICFVEVPGMKFSPVKIRNSEDVKVGEAVYAVGNPEGLEKSISQGIISNKRKDRGGYVLQTDATVSFGSSGGGLFDQNGDLVGITNSVDRYSKNIAFALPSEWITQILFPKDSDSQEKLTKPVTTVRNETPPKDEKNKPAESTKDQNTASNDKATTPADKEQADQKSVKKVGTYGKANIALYQYNNKCFILFPGKNEFGEAAGSAIWYPEKPGIILIFPNSVDVAKNFEIMNKAFYGKDDESPVYSSDYLYFGDKKYELVGIKDENGKFPLLVTKLPDDAKDKLPKMSTIDVKFGDGNTVEGYTKASFGLDGFEDAMSNYSKTCGK